MEPSRVTLYSAIVGSKLHGTDLSQSDTDRRSVYRLSLSDRLNPFVEESTRKLAGEDHTAFELTHFARMLAKNNPTAMEVAFSTKSEGDKLLITSMREVALDTERYVGQANGFIQGMFNNGTAKALHHGVRMATHLRHYIETGELVYDTRKFADYGYLMRVKIGQITPHYREFAKQEVDTIHHVQDLDRLANLVYNSYIRDMEEWYDGG